MKSKKKIKKKLNNMCQEWFSFDLKTQKDKIVEYGAYMAALEWVLD